MSLEELKRQAGYEAVDKFVRSGMVLGLGTGSTVKYAIDRIGDLLKDGKLTDIKGIPTSVATEKQARSLNIPLVDLHEIEHIDVAIDGADEIDAKLNLVKGRGGALLREKMVERIAKTLVIIADETKDTPAGLGNHGSMPVEVTVFGADHIRKQVLALPALQGVKGLEGKFRLEKDSQERYKTDNGNYILELYATEPFTDSYAVAHDLAGVCGVVEHGLFLDMTDVVIFATTQGLKVIEKQK